MAAQDRPEGGSAYLEHRKRQAVGEAPVRPVAPSRIITTTDVERLRELVQHVRDNAIQAAKHRDSEFLKGWSQGRAAACAWVEKELDRLLR